MNVYNSLKTIEVETGKGILLGNTNPIVSLFGSSALDYITSGDANIEKNTAAGSAGMVFDKLVPNSPFLREITNKYLEHLVEQNKEE